MADRLSRKAPPGQLFKVNGHRLHLSCMGEGSPAVVFESGQNGFSMDWMLVQSEVAHFTRACAYDRAGLGWSESGSQLRTSDQIVTELRALLVNAEVPKPYILVAHSLGGRFARLYAHRFPDDIAGLVMVDTDQEIFDELIGQEQLRKFMAGRSKQYAFLDWAARLGLVRLFSNQLLNMLVPEMRALGGEVKRFYAEMITRPGALRMSTQEYEQAVVTDEQLRAVALPKNIPLRVLAHGVPWPYPDYEAAWQESQKRLAALSPEGQLVVAEKSGHFIMFSQPELVVNVIQELVETLRTAHKLT